MAESLTFAIFPEAQSASLDLFLKAMDNVYRLVRDVDYAVTQERTGRRWIIAQLQSSAPTVTLRTLLGDTETIDAVAKGLRIVTTGADDPPEFFTESALNELRRMRRLFVGKDRASRVVVSVDHEETATLREDISAKVQRILAGGYRDLGSLEGTLEAINLHGTPAFTIWDRISRAPVRCSFPRTPEWINKVKQLLERRVLVRGEIRYFANGLPRAIAGIEAVEDATHLIDSSPGNFGSIPDKEAAQDPVAFLRSKRGVGRE